jgi:hypothetical protein
VTSKMDEPVPSVSRKPRSKGRASGKGGGYAKDSDLPGKNESAAEKLARQIFVGGLPSSITQEKFREWADETWPGAVTHVQVIYTFQERHHHARPRGFGFITFRDAGCVDNALEIRHRPFGPKIVELKKVFVRFVDSPIYSLKIFDSIKFNNPESFFTLLINSIRDRPKIVAGKRFGAARKSPAHPHRPRANKWRNLKNKRLRRRRIHLVLLSS